MYFRQDSGIIFVFKSLFWTESITDGKTARVLTSCMLWIEVEGIWGIGTQGKKYLEQGVKRQK